MTAKVNIKQKNHPHVHLTNDYVNLTNIHHDDERKLRKQTNNMKNADKNILQHALMTTPHQTKPKMKLIQFMPQWIALFTFTFKFMIDWLHLQSVRTAENSDINKKFPRVDK